jgi:signal transduction histidine kinase
MLPALPPDCMPFTAPLPESVIASAIAAAGEPVAVLGADGTFLYANGEFVRLLGASEDAAVLGQPWQKFFPGAASSSLAERFPPAAEPSSRWRGRLQVREFGGPERALDVVLSALPDRHALLLAHPVTNGPVAEGNVVMPREFLSKISHEFRTPLATMQGVLYLLQRDLGAQPGEKRQRWLDHLRESMTRLRELADQVLEWNRLEGAAVKTQRAELDVAAFAARLAAHADELAGTPRCTLELAPDVPARLVVNETVLRMVLDQFLANALKFSPAPTPVRLVVTRAGPRVRFAVVDQGRGVPEAEQPGVWQPFFRASNAVTEPGSGLGLMLARRAAELLDAEVNFHSRPGAGSSFWIDLSA